MFVCPFYLYFVLENEDASPNECEELFDIPAYSLSPKHEDTPLNTLPGISGSCKLEADTQESGTPYLDNEGTFLTFFVVFLVSNTSNNILLIKSKGK